MNTAMLSRVRRLHPYTETAQPHTVRHNRRAWVRSVRSLGDKWVLKQFTPHMRKELTA